MAMGRPLDGPGIFEQSHGAVPTALLGGLLRALARGPQTLAAPRTVFSFAGQSAFGYSGVDLERATPVGYFLPYSRPRGRRPSVGADPSTSRSEERRVGKE